MKKEFISAFSVSSSSSFYANQSTRPSSSSSSGLSLLSIVIFGDDGRWNLGIRKPLAIRIIQIQVHLVPLILHLRWLRCARTPFSERSTAKLQSLAWRPSGSGHRTCQQVVESFERPLTLKRPDVRFRCAQTKWPPSLPSSHSSRSLQRGRAATLS